MKLTQQQIRKIIKEELQKALSEAAIDLSTLREDYKILIRPDPNDSQQIMIEYADQNGNPIPYNKDGIPYGVVVVDTIVQSKEEFQCSDAMMISFSDATDKYGPLLYDIAIEVATLKGAGLVSDRTILTNDGYKVWNYYFRKRSGPECDKPATKSYYEKIGKKCPTKPKELSYAQLDDEDGTLTPEISSDDCLQTISREYAKKKKKNWSDMPVSKIYKKEPTTIKALGDKLILKGISL